MAALPNKAGAFKALQGREKPFQPQRQNNCGHPSHSGCLLPPLKRRLCDGEATLQIWLALGDCPQPLFCCPGLEPHTGESSRN